MFHYQVYLSNCEVFYDINQGILQVQPGYSNFLVATALVRTVHRFRTLVQHFQTRRWAEGSFLEVP